MLRDIKIEDYDYPLPEGRIAKFPLEHRDDSKLLVYTASSGESPVESSFKDISRFLPSGGVMIFNKTKVVPARLFFQRPTGAIIEVFCLEPAAPSDYQLNFASTARCDWKVIVGNLKKWKGDTLSLFNPDKDPVVDAIGLKAILVDNAGNSCIVRFEWDNGMSFSEVLSHCGRIPIPPYLKRDTQAIDLERYQTLYAHVRGSVAAPTAGLHFTEEVLEAIRAKHIDTQNVCLHVGAGTFLPVKSSNVADHPMHREPFSVSLDLLRKLKANGCRCIAVGTTSVRTLESLYYAGVSIIEKGAPEDIAQWVPYEREYPYSTEEAIDAIISWLEANSLTDLRLGTRIIIVPGFRFRIVEMMVTNFHQPESTLILLISAFVGGDWKTIYNFALSHGFRFLSYGDSSLLFRKD